MPRRLIAALAPTLLFLFVLEAGARLVCSRRFAPYATSIGVQGDSRWAASPVTIWGNRPRYLEYDLSGQYNDYGMRVPPGETRMPEKRPADFWVFLLGGSAMAGMGSNQDGEWLRITGVPSHPIADAIDGQLERMLQTELPARRVRVFNAAVASHTLLQSRLGYERLRHLRPDWVISMDGANDAASLAPGETRHARLAAEWTAHPIHRFPFREARFLMKRSAFLFLGGEYLFFRSGAIRNARNTRQDPQVLETWSRREPGSGEPSFEASTETARAKDEFLRELRLFDRTLDLDGQKHLLLVQPHLSLRERSKLHGAERAVFNYYVAQSQGRGDSFLAAVHRDFAAHRSNDRVIAMSGAHAWEGWVFVDYCHFSKEANRRIAAGLRDAILSDGARRPFEP